MKSVEERFIINNPREKLEKEQARVAARLGLVDQYEETANAIFEAAKQALPDHTLVEMELQPQINWDNNLHAAVEVNVTEALAWSDAAGFLEELDKLGYSSEEWKSADNPEYFSRHYYWRKDSFSINLYVVLNENNPSCKRVLVRVERETPSPYERKIYAFDCGEGAEAAIARANFMG